MIKPDLYQDLQDIMACPLCLDRCTQPRSLPCLHVFCESCLSQLTEKSATKGTLLCPSCRTETKVPEGETASLRTARAASLKAAESASSRTAESASLRTAESASLRTARAAPRLVDTSPDGKLMAKKMSQFKVPFYPRGVACTPDNNVIVCTYHGNKVPMYKPYGQLITKMQTPQNLKASDVMYADNSILVADLTTKSIVVFDDNGSCTRSIPVSWSTDYVGAGISIQNNKLFVAVFGDDKLYVMDWTQGGNKTVLSHGQSEIKLQGPVYVATNQTQVAISCLGNKTVQLYDLSGQLQFTYTGQGSHVQALSHPHDILIDSAGRILVSDSNNHCIHILSNHGQFLGYIDLKQDGLQWPRGLALNSHGQLVVAAESSLAITTYQYTA